MGTLLGRSTLEIPNQACPGDRPGFGMTICKPELACPEFISGSLLNDLEINRNGYTLYVRADED